MFVRTELQEKKSFYVEGGLCLVFFVCFFLILTIPYPQLEIVCDEDFLSNKNETVPSLFRTEVP